MVGQNAIEMQRSCILQPNALQLEQERRALDAYKTKVARCMRKLARQRRLGRASSGASSTRITDASRLALHGAGTDGQNSRTNTSKDLFEFLTPDNKVRSCQIMYFAYSCVLPLSVTFFESFKNFSCLGGAETESVA
jgi:hypothetical protein